MAGRWTLWCMPAGDVVPSAREFDRLEDAMEAAGKIAEGRARITWLKVFRSDDEYDVRARWTPEGNWTHLSGTASEVLGVFGMGAYAGRRISEVVEP